MQVCKKFIVTLNTIEKGLYFGETDFIEGCPRKTRALSIQNLVCLTINKTEFFEVFSTRDVKILKQMKSIEIPADEELQKRLEKEISQRNISVFDI